MSEQNNQEGFSYTYSAKEREEIRRIRQKYEPKQPSSMERLRELDRSVYRKGTTASLIVGIIGALTLGGGMSCCMVWADTLFIPGIVIGCAGIAMVTAAYPLYNAIVRKERQKIAPEILRITDELMK